MNGGDYLSGRLLLAMPGMADPRFAKAVIALCVHDENGALGIGIGRVRPQLTFHELLDSVGMEPGEAPDCPVHNGGPVEPNRGFVLHSPDWSDDDTVVVNDKLALSASMQVLRAITEGKGPQRWLAALGYAGWGAGQLDAEMHGHGWFVAECKPEIVFATPAEARWTGAWRAEGVDPALLANTTGQA